MTCVVALRDRDHTYLGADSAGVGGLSLSIRKDRKIYRVGPTLIGFTTSFRMGQLLGYSLTVPEHHSDIGIERYMATSFINEVRATLKNGGFAAKDKDVESGGAFIVAYRDRIFQIDSDFQVGESTHSYCAIGCGMDLALGSLYTTSRQSLAPDERVRLALEAAETFSAGVRGPFHIETLPGVMA